MVEGSAALGRPLQELDGSVDRDALLVAGDEKGDRPLRPSAAGDEVIERGGERAGHGALHVDRAASVERAVDDLAGERRMAPSRRVARRHHVGVPGEDEVRGCAADAGVEVFDRLRAGLGEGYAVNLEACDLQHPLDEPERAAFRRGHRRAAQQVAGEGDGIHGLEHVSVR